jgi:hypothetical protein
MQQTERITRSFNARSFVFAVLALLSACASMPSLPVSAVNIDLVCSTGQDTDGDSLTDECELAFGRSFAPELIVSRYDCNWDASVGDGRLGGEYYFGVQKVSPDTVRLVYLPAYYRDCGWQGPKCEQPIIPCEGHSGDSEFIAIDVLRNDSGWRAARIFLSSHCFDKFDGYCRWYEGGDLDGFGWRNARYGAPTVWVAEGKGAHYRSRSECDRGHIFYDTCDRNSVRWTYEIASQRQNIGSLFKPAGDRDGCVSSRHAGWGSEAVAEPVVECFWKADSRFAGWQQPGSGNSTPYERYLREIARFKQQH